MTETLGGGGGFTLFSYHLTLILSTHGLKGRVTPERDVSSTASCSHPYLSADPTPPVLTSPVSTLRVRGVQSTTTKGTVSSLGYRRCPTRGHTTFHGRAWRPTTSTAVNSGSVSTNPPLPTLPRPSSFSSLVLLFLSLFLSPLLMWFPRVVKNSLRDYGFIN